jgi:hypothetical protein
MRCAATASGGLIVYPAVEQTGGAFPEHYIAWRPITIPKSATVMNLQVPTLELEIILQTLQRQPYL